MRRHSRLSIAIRLVERVLPERHRDPIVGDLIEEYELRSRSSTPWRATCWYWGQVCRTVFGLTWAAACRGDWLATVSVACGIYLVAQALEFASTRAISTAVRPNPFPAEVISVGVGLTMLAIGGYVATWIRRGAGSVLAAIAMIVVAALMTASSGSAPKWYGIAFLVVGPSAALIGAGLCRARSLRAARRAKY